MTLWEPKFQNATPTNRSRQLLNFSWMFFPMVLTKIRMGFLKLGFFFVFLNIGPYAIYIPYDRSQNFKMLLFLQIAGESVQAFPEFSSHSQAPCLGFLTFWKLKFNEFVFVFVNMGPYGSQNFKAVFLLQIAAQRFETTPDFFSIVLTKLRLEFLKFWNWNFNEFIALLDYSQDFFSYLLSLGRNFDPPPHTHPNPGVIFFKIEWFPPMVTGKASTKNKVDRSNIFWYILLLDTQIHRQHKVGNPAMHGRGL